MVTSREKSERAVTGAEGSASEWTQKGDAFRNEGRYEEALQCYEKSLEMDPRNGRVWRYRAQALAMRFRYEESVESCEKALELNPSDGEAWSLKGFALEMLGKHQEALESCVKGLEIDPGNTVAWCTKGEYLYAMGRLEEAMESFGTALTIDPENEYAKDVNEKVVKWLRREGGTEEWINKVVEFLKRGKHKDALQSYTDAMMMDPRAREKSFDKDFALARLEKPEQLLEEYEKAKRENQAQIRVELSQKEFQLGVSSWVEVMVSNSGTGAARDMTLQFPLAVKVQYLDVDPELVKSGEKEAKLDMQLIALLNPGERKTKLISLVAEKVGHFPLDIKIRYVDPWGKKQQEIMPLWVQVFKPGQQLPKIPGYDIVWRMSSGDSDNIYIAKRIKDGVKVIVKIPHLATDQASLITEFVRKVKQWGKLSHPNVVAIDQYGDRPFPWIAMEYMEKGPLRKRIGKLSIGESLQIGMSLAEVLSYSKRLLVTHRDIRPENVLFDSKDVPRLTNWEVKNVMLKLSKNATGAKGASVYSAPEAVSTDFGGADWRTDIYQLGVLLYEMITGKTPFQGEEKVLVEKITKEQPKGPSELNARIGKHLDSIILKCLAKHKEDRYQDVLSLKADLEKAFEIHGYEKGVSP